MSRADLPPNAAFTGEDWPTFGWAEDVRPALAAAQRGGRRVALATLYRVDGNAPRGPGAQMLFDGAEAAGYFSGGCVEADIAQHAAAVLANGAPRRLHYGAGSPWADIKLRCGGAIHILVEAVDARGEAATALLAHGAARTPALWISDGRTQRVAPDHGAPTLSFDETTGAIARRYDPPLRLIVSGWDPTALALAKLGVDAQFETFLARAQGPEQGPPLDGVAYLSMAPEDALAAIGVDAFTAFVGATHDSDLDIAACAKALAGGAAYVGLVGAAARAPGQVEAILAAGAPASSLPRLHAPPGRKSMGKAPWRIAIGVIGEILETLNTTRV